MLRTLWEVKVLRFLLLAGRKCSGSEMISELGVSSGTLYPLLRNLKKKGLIAGFDEVEDPKKLGRPLFRFYSLSKSGNIQIRDTLDELSI